MDLKIQPDAGKSEIKKRAEVRRYKDPTWGIVWRFILCALIINIALQGYFRLVKGVPLLVGIQQMQDQVRENRHQKRQEKARKEIAMNIERKPAPTQAKPPNTHEAERARIERERKREREATQAAMAKILDAQRVAAEQEKLRLYKEKTKKMTPIYSWRDERGYQGFSNIGFPEDGKYTEGKVEWSSQ